MCILLLCSLPAKQNSLNAASLQESVHGLLTKQLAFTSAWAIAEAQRYSANLNKYAYIPLSVLPVMLYLSEFLLSKA